MPIVDDFLLGRSPEFPLNPTAENRTDLFLTQNAAPTGRVRGSVTNSVDSNPLAGVTVKVRTQSGDPIAHDQTNSAGRYSIGDIAPGTYTIDVALHGFVSPSGQTFTMQAGQILDVNFSMTPEVRALNVVFGLITNQSTGALVTTATVAIILAPLDLTDVRGQQTNSSGQYLCGDLPDGTYIAAVVAEGFKETITVPFTISGGTNLQMNLTIQPVNVPQATVNGFIKQQNGTPIPNACVGLYSLDLGGTETLLQVAYTSSTGFYFFGRVPGGNFVVKAKSEKVATVPG